MDLALHCQIFKVYLQLFLTPTSPVHLLSRTIEASHFSQSGQSIVYTLKALCSAQIHHQQVVKSFHLLPRCRGQSLLSKYFSFERSQTKYETPTSSSYHCQIQKIHRPPETSLSAAPHPGAARHLEGFPSAPIVPPDGGKPRKGCTVGSRSIVELPKQKKTDVNAMQKTEIDFQSLTFRCYVSCSGSFTPSQRWPLEKKITTHIRTSHCTNSKFKPFEI